MTLVLWFVLWLRAKFVKRQNTDVKVMGLVAGTHVIEDLNIDVPYGVYVTIPGDRAVGSKDLWRAISAKCVFHVPSAPAPSVSVVRAPSSAPDQSQRVAELEQQLGRLQAENDALRREADQRRSGEAKLDLILSMLPNLATGGSAPAAVSPSAAPSEIADGTVPTFFPSTIVPRDVEASIEIEAQSSNGGGISAATEALRKMRKR